MSDRATHIRRENKRSEDGREGDVGGDPVIRRLKRELEVARRITTALCQHTSTQDLAKVALQTAVWELDAEAGSILIADPECKELVFRHVIGPKSPRPGMRFSWKEGIAGHVFTTGEIVLTPDAEKDPRHNPSIDEATGFTTRDLIALPLRRWRGVPIGAMEIMNGRTHPLNNEDLALLTIISAVTAAWIERAQLHEEAKLAEVARFLGNVAHDMNNLLLPISIGVGVLQEDMQTLFETLAVQDSETVNASRQRCREILEMFVVSTQRMHDRLKGIGACVSGAILEQEFTPCRIRSIIQGVYECVQWQALRAGILLRTSKLENLPEIIGDEHGLFNAFYNLVINAIPEVRPGGSITIQGSEDKRRDGVVVSVVDTGRGLPPEIRDDLFRGRRKSRKRGGTGLGLKIVKGTVEAHGGNIVVESEPGLGTAFHVFLPLAPKQHAPGQEDIIENQA